MKIISILFISILFLWGKLNLIVSIPPQAFFLNSITKDKASIYTILSPKDSPHTYEPKPKDMINISKGDIYFTIGVEFEKGWINRFKAQNQNLKIIDSSKGIKRIPIENRSLKKDDPHIWTSIENAKIIATNMANTLIKYDSNNSSFYKENLKSFYKRANFLKEKIKNILKETPKGKCFLTLHPSWGYFAKEFNLCQLSIERGGKNPTLKELILLSKKIKEDNIKSIIIDPAKSFKAALPLIEKLHLKIVKISPLSKNWEESLIKLAKTIANKE